MKTDNVSGIRGDVVCAVGDYIAIRPVSGGKIHVLPSNGGLTCFVVPREYDADADAGGVFRNAQRDIVRALGLEAAAPERVDGAAEGQR